MKKVVYYARVSTEETNQLAALSRQKEELEEHIHSQDEWQLVDKYVDEGKSGTSSKGRKQYQRLYNDLEADKFDIVVIKDISRLNRDTLSWYLFIDRLIKNEKKLFFYDTKSFYTTDEQLLIGIKALISEQYSRDLSKKINMANKQRAKKGRVVTNGTLWGYNQFDGQLTIDEEQAEVVRKVFEMYADGLGFRGIVQELTKMGIRNQNGNEFSLTTLKRMIKNEKYKGVLISNKKHKDFDTKKINDVPKENWIIKEGAVPAIVSTELWDKANEVLSSKRKTYIKEGKEKEVIAGYFKGSYVYSGKIKCGTCGKPYWHQTYSTLSKKTNKEYDLWQCSTYRSFGKNTEHGCKNPHIKTEELDKMVKKVIFDFWNNKDEVIDKIIIVLDSSLEENGSKDGLIKFEVEINKHQKRKENLINMRMNDEISKEEFITQKEKIDDIIDSIHKQIIELEEKDKERIDKKERLINIKKFLGEKLKSPDGITDEIIQQYLKEITIKEDGEVLITLDGDFSFAFKKEGEEYVMY
ncbi:MAG: recombinase family protein [Anaerovorax sp.]|nr:recombinase family protein [Anaerovorax sp.]